MTLNRGQLLNDQLYGLELMMDGRQSKTWTAMPGVVQSADFGEMTCTVQLAIQGNITTEDGITQPANYPLLIHCPIVFPKAGGFTITFPLVAGDEVLVLFSSRCIDSWWQSGGVNNRPMELRMHDLSDGFALPGPTSQPRTISGISSTGLQIRNDAGTTYIEIAADGKIKIVSPVEIDITGNVVVSGSLIAASIATSGGGAIATTGTITASVDVVGGGKSLATHEHPVTTAPGNTGPPI